MDLFIIIPYISWVVKKKFTDTVKYDKYILMETYDEVIKSLYDEHPIDQLVSFSELDIHTKLSEHSQLLTLYTEHLNKERAKLEHIGSLRDSVIGKRYDYYRFNYDKELKPSEIEKYYLPMDEHVRKANSLYTKQSWRVDFFNMCVKSIDKMGWNMKNFLEALKL